MELTVTAIGLICGGIAGYRLMPAQPDWAAPWCVAGALWAARLVLTALKKRPVSADVAGGAASIAVLLIEKFSGVTLAPAVIIFWLFALFQSFSLTSALKPEGAENKLKGV